MNIPIPANNAAVMKASPREVFGIASGMLRTFANVGMLFSFSTALLIGARSIPRGLAFAIFVGTAQLHGRLAVAFTTGLHAAFYDSIGFLAVAAVFWALVFKERHQSGLAGAGKVPVEAVADGGLNTSPAGSHTAARGLSLPAGPRPSHMLARARRSSFSSVVRGSSVT